MRMKDRTEAARIGVVVYPGVEPIDLGGTVGVVSMASRLLPALTAVTIAAAAGPVLLSGGLTVVAGHGFGDAPACDVLIVCGGPGWVAQARDPAMLAFLRDQSPARVASVCTGALILAAAGLLDGRRATTRRRAVGAEDQAPLQRLAVLGTDVRPTEALVVDDGVVTGGGVSLAIDTTLYLIGRLYGPAVRDDVAHAMEYERAWQANRAALGIVSTTNQSSVASFSGTAERARGRV